MSHKMRRNEMLDIADTNMANFGTELEHNIKQAAADGEPAWDGVGQEEGVRIWRIEQFKVVAWPVEEYGKFYTGDSYILLYTRREGDSFIYHIHFWLGRYTTQDEAGTAAYKTVELDDKLGGKATQHREVQGLESAEFAEALQHCPGGAKTIYLMEGGVESGFRHVVPEEWVPRLFHVHKPSGGKARVREVQCCLESFDRSDVMLLDLGKTIFQWNGASASPFEKSAGSAEAQSLVGEGSYRPDAKHVVVDDDGDGDVVKEGEMLEHLKPADEEQRADMERVKALRAAHAEAASRPRAIMRLCDAGGSLQFSQVADKLDKGVLSSEDAFVVDAGSQVYVWVGSGASKAERTQGLSFAQRYLKENGCPPTVPIAVIAEGAETKAFSAAMAA
eukprot:TRINITY_DN32073_c0_g1_i1.p1 TRINITY_DN32073_c0_g1~~TRINITY_DN32073_c0_g1_i1.p1  ORF type:complete len:410 (+),score=162.28 TRINITY_DN32073_c0_g1_i1:63-1232(+)